MDSSSTTKPWKYVVLVTTLAFPFLILYCSSCNNLADLGRISSSFKRYNTSSSSLIDEPAIHDEYYDLRKLLKSASTKEKTVILTYLNEAWAAPNSIFDIFLESFRIGNNTLHLLDHLLVIALDDKAYYRCKSSSVTHCYFLNANNQSLSLSMASQANFMTPRYFEMMWGRLAFLKTILTFGYNFLITDTDIVWFRDPFPHFTPDSDFQTSCDVFNGKEFDIHNFPNMGFLFVRSNNRTIKLYEFWLSSRQTYPQLHEQNVFNKIKFDPFFEQIGVKVRFLSPDYFGGFCRPSRDFNKVCTMHANCRVGLRRKIADLNTTLNDWRFYMSSSNHTNSQAFHWSAITEYRQSVQGSMNKQRKN